MVEPSVVRSFHCPSCWLVWHVQRTQNSDDRALVIAKLLSAVPPPAIAVLFAQEMQADGFVPERVAPALFNGDDEGPLPPDEDDEGPTITLAAPLAVHGGQRGSD